MKYSLQFFFIFFFALFALSALTSCQSLQPLQAPAGKALFPDGTYQQHVFVQVLSKPPRSFEFDALMKKKAEVLNIYGYNSFGISLLVVKSDGNKEATLDSDIEEISKNKSLFLRFFPILKKVVYASNEQYPTLLPRLEKELRGQIILKFEEPASIPRSFQIVSPNHYQVTITNRKYDP